MVAILCGWGSNPASQGFIHPNNTGPTARLTACRCHARIRMVPCLVVMVTVAVPWGYSSNLFIKLLNYLKDHLLFELTFHLSDVKSKLLTHELILCLKISRRRLHFIGDLAEKILAGSEFETWDLPTQIFFDLPSLLTGLHTVGPIQVASTLRDCFAASCLQHSPIFPRALRLERVCNPSAWLTSSSNGAWHYSSITFHCRSAWPGNGC